MSSDCIHNAGLDGPTSLDVCHVNHAGYPVLPMMYGDSFTAGGQSLAYGSCP
jgi:hypothetical protein